MCHWWLVHQCDNLSLVRNGNVPHRKLVKHIDRPGRARGLTFSCYRRFPLLNDNDHKLLLTEAIDRAISGHGFQLVGFVYMPEHVHLIVLPIRQNAGVSGLLKAIKRPHSFRVKQRMRQSNDPWLGRLTVQERPGKAVFRFWQEGSGYDRDIVSGRYLEKAVEYLHANPVRRGLCPRPEEWRWSSWHHYQGERQNPGLPTVGGLPETELLT